MVVKMRYCDLCGARIPRSNIFTLADFLYIRSGDDKYLGEQEAREICLNCSEKISAYMNKLRGEKECQKLSSMISNQSQK